MPISIFLVFNVEWGYYLIFISQAHTFCVYTCKVLVSIAIFKRYFLWTMNYELYEL